MMDLQAGFGINQLQRAEQYRQRRQISWRRYNDAFDDLPINLPADLEPDTRHVYHSYTILVDGTHTGISRDSFLDAMIAQNTDISVHYLSIPEHPRCQRTYGWKPEDYPSAMRVEQQTVSSPLSAKLTNEDVEGVSRAVKAMLASKYE